MIQYIDQGNLEDLCGAMANVLESVTIPEHPEIAVLKECMLANGAMGALMSGSGPTVFGIYADREQAMFAKEKCKQMPFKTFAFVTDLYR